MSVCLMPVCKHSKPIKLGCQDCDMEKINDSHHQFSKEVVEGRVNILFNHICKISEDIITLNKAKKDDKEAIDNLWEDHARKVGDIEAVCEVIEKIQEKVGGIESFIDESKKVLKEDLDKHFKWYESVEHRLDLLANDLARTNKFKKPHKCPICNGIGRVATAIANLAFDEALKAGLDMNRECNGCEGKGIVWG